MKRTFLVAVALAFIIASCQQAPVEYVRSVDTLYIRDTVNNVLTGTLHGKARLYGPYGLVADNSGITVTMEGTAHSATTDSAGNWALHDLPTGSYNITYSRAGYEPYKIFGYSFVGGAESYLLLPDVDTYGSQLREAYPVLISRLAPVTVSDVAMMQSTLIPDIWYLSVQVSPVLPNLSLSLLFGRDSSLSPADSSSFVMSTSMTGGNGRWEMDNHDMVTAGFQRGEKVFVACYSSYRSSPSFPAVYSYWDPFSNNSVTPVFKDKVRSNVVSFTLP
jgi:hypothetical protein